MIVNKAKNNHPARKCGGSILQVVRQQLGSWRVAHSGGNSNNGGQAGFATLNANNSSSNRNSNIGSRESNESPCRATLPLGKTQNHSHQVLVGGSPHRTFREHYKEAV